MEAVLEPSGTMTIDRRGGTPLYNFMAHIGC